MKLDVVCVGVCMGLLQNWIGEEGEDPKVKRE